MFSPPAPSVEASDRPTLSAASATLAERRFDAVIFDWDGTAVPDRRAGAEAVRARVEALCAAGVHVFVVSGTNLDNVDGQLRARPAGPGALHLCLNRGSEVFAVDADGPRVVWRRTATTDDERALDDAATATVDLLGGHGVETRVVSQRLNRRKIDLIPVPQWDEPPKARIAALLIAVQDRLGAAGVAGLAQVVALARGAATAAGLADPRITSDVKHVEIGLTDKSDSASWAAAWLAQRGIGAGLVLVGGDEFGPIGGVPGSDSFMLVAELTRATVVSVGVEPGGVPGGVAHAGGGPDQWLQILDGQLGRRRDRRVPWIDEDPAWVLRLPEEPELERAAESIGVVGNGWAALRAAREDAGVGSAPRFFVNGVYTAGPTPELLAGPRWADLALRSEAGPGRRLLDLRTGVLASDGDDEAAIRTFRFVSAARPSALALRAEGPASELGSVLVGAGDDDTSGEVPGGDVHGARTGDGSGGGIAVAARDWEEVTGGRRVIQRLAAWTAHRSTEPGSGDARDQLAEVEAVGFDRLLDEHRQAWARRWADAEVSIDGAPGDQLAARFAVFHLLAAAHENGEAAVGARGLTGAAYGGHVFWDADVFVLPALAAIWPGAARAMLEYRIRRLPAARSAAAEQARLGARFPWESADTGSDVTPRQAVGSHGERIAIMTGQHEEHIDADVAWAASTYATWSGDGAFLAGAGRDLVVDTARYWASRARLDPDGRAHLAAVMGPDEYHQVVDDNAYTNVMARWNLRRAAELVNDFGGDRSEAAAWGALADAVVDGYDPKMGVYEQFAGYFDLESLLIADIAPPPVAADVVLGAERVAGSQIIKQADVLMLHHLVPDEVVAGSLTANLAYYGPRTAHGSSLSPAVHASLLARAHQPDRALDLFRLAARLDLDDLTGTTAGGLHLATMGGVWQALAYGFLGLQPRADSLAADPCLPSQWAALQMRLRFRGSPIGVHATHDTLTISCAQPLVVGRPDGSTWRCEPPGRSIALDDRSQP